MSMVSYHIRQYQERDHKRVVDLYSETIAELALTGSHRLLKLPRTMALLLGGPLAVLLLTGSWLLTLLAGLLLFAALQYFGKVPWLQFKVMALNSDMSDISKYYLSGPGSCFWVAESQGRVVGTVGALPVKEPALSREHLELFHLCVDSTYRGQGIAKALVRTVLQFGQDHGYRAIVLSTSSVQYAALGLYQRLGFRKTQEYFYSLTWRLNAIPFVRLVYYFPSAPVSQRSR
ncbi:putative N-acetyltransferase 8B [Sorex araneus]|uniref:putative N-acetyltransferase 8B n=1 Tax=Sorex araneus TaxID=42254 RepID=UPI002433AC30|nr:putative N-acetyltransferase 8B [Sorex araneus]XP_054978444.1 putative N-acetyltransferase 8B [Sorex araneus]